MRTVIVEDEPQSRKLLQRMLAAHPEIELVGEAADGAAAVAQVRAHRPELLLLDVQLPELNGFEVLRALEDEPLPQIIFVTAYDQYALKAFEFAAVDYLLKPFDEDRLAAALRRVLARRGTPEGEAPLRTLLGSAPTPRLERIPVRSGERIQLIPVGQIDWVEAQGKYVVLHVGAQQHELRQGISRLEESLDPKTFVRVSRSAIVNVEKVQELRAWFQGDYELVLRTGARVTTTRGYRDRLNALLKPFD